MKPTLLALVGPTGSGKTQTAIDLAGALDAEIVSMDSMQVYRGMDIGTAKPTAQQRAAAVHHMLDVADPHERFTTAAYRDMATQVIGDILARGKRVLLAGGTGLYLQALSTGMALGEQGADDALRSRLRALAEQPGGEKQLHAMLAEADPQAAARLHPNDVRRVIRALEICESTGKREGERVSDAHQEGPYRVCVYGLSLPREQMYARINARVDEMMLEGLVDEVKSLLAQGVEPRAEGGAMQAIGYKEIVSALRGEIPMERAVELIKQGSRRYAKRQWTWFRRDPDTRWYDWTQYPSAQALENALLCQMRLDLAQGEEPGRPGK